MLSPLHHPCSPNNVMRIFNDNVVAFYYYGHLSCNARQSFLPQSRLGVIFVETARRKETKGFLGGGVGWSVSLRLFSVRHSVTVLRCASHGELTVFIRNPTEGKIHEGTS